MGLPFEVGPSVLMPRQETEILVEEALKDLHSGMRILDLCTGSGCILLSLLRYSHECTGVGIDISEEALALAKKNGDAILGEDAPVRSVFFRSDLFEKVEGTFDLVISNPPYIPEAVIDTLEPEVALHDPRIALEGGKDGLSFYRRIIEDLHRFLKPGGTVLFEIGHDQGEAVSKLLQDRGYKYTEVLKDLSGLDRVVKAHRSVL
jgi:release factor glutamine methyltransferase